MTGNFASFVGGRGWRVEPCTMLSADEVVLGRGEGCGYVSFGIGRMPQPSEWPAVLAALEASAAIVKSQQDTPLHFYAFERFG